MSTQIYIDKAAIDHLIEDHDIDRHTDCTCGQHDSDHVDTCSHCGRPITTYVTEYYKYQGLGVWLISFEEKVYQDAKQGGTLRTRILEWLKSHNISERHYHFA